MAVEDLTALTPEEIQERLKAYFDSEAGKSYLDNITASTSDEYTKASLEESGASNIAGALSFVSPLDSDALETWKSQNQVTDDNNNSFLENDQLFQLKVFAASQPKYVPIVPGEGDRRQQRMAEASKTPGAIYSDFGAYSLALQAHNKNVASYVEQEDIPTSITTPDGVEMSLNLGMSPMYYNEQNDGGRLSQKHKNGATGDYYKQLGGVGEYGTYYVKEKKTDWRDSLEASIPYFAAFVGISVIGPAIAAKMAGGAGTAAGTAAGTGTAATGTGTAAGVSSEITKILTTTMPASSYTTATAGVTSTISNAINAVGSTISSVAGAVSGAIAEGIAAVIPGVSAEAIAPTIDVLGSITAASKGISYAEQYKNQQTAEAIGGAISTAANGLPSGVIYSGPGAGGDGVFDPNVIYNLTEIATANNGAAEDEEAAEAINVTAIAAEAIAGIANPDEDEAVVAANTAVSEAETGLEEAAGNVATVVEEENAKADGAESYARYVASRYGTRSFAYRNAKKRADKAKLDARNKISKAQTAASVAQAELEDARKAQAGAARDADDAYKSARAQAIRDAQAKANKQRSEIDARNAARKAELEEIQNTTTTDQETYNSALEESNTNANNSAAEIVENVTSVTDAVEEITNKVTEEAQAEAVKPAEEPSAEEVQKAKDQADQIITDAAEAAAAETEAPDYTKVEATPDGADALPADEQEIKDQATTPPVDEKIKEDIAEPPKYPEKEEVIEEAETDDGGGGGGGGGAGEGAGAGQGGDTGADAEVGTTTTAETGEAGAAGTDEAEPPVTVTEEPYTGSNNYDPNKLARQLYEAYLQEADTELKGAILEEYEKYTGTTLPPDEAFGVWTEAKNDAARATAEAAEAAEEAARYTSGMDVATGDAAKTVGQWVQLANGAWKNTITGKIAAPTAVSGGSGEGEWEVLNPDGTGTGEVINEYSDDTGAEPDDDISIGLPTDEDTKEEAAGTTGAGEETGTTTTTDTGTSTTGAPTDTTTTATTSTGTAGATTTPTETTTGGAGTGEDLGTSDTAADQDQTGAGADGAGTGTTGPADEVGAGDADATGTGTGAADVTGTGTGASGTPGAGAGEVGDPGDVGEGTGTGAGTGTGTGGGTGSGTGTGTGSGEGPGTGSGTGGGQGSGRGVSDQVFAALMQPQQVQVKAAPVADIGTPYDFSSIFASPEQAGKFVTPYGVRKAAAGGVIRSDTDTIMKQLERKNKPVDTMEDLFRIIGGK